MSIESDLQRLKEWYWHNWSLCLFCNHKVRKHGDLAHLIRKSASRQLQTLKLNTGLAHRECHDIFDDRLKEAVFLPRFYECMYLIWKMDIDYYGQLSYRYSSYGIWLPDYFLIDPKIPSIDHHGELLTLQPLLLMQIERKPLRKDLPLLPVLLKDH
jgi:hypothetical protein